MSKDQHELTRIPGLESAEAPRLPWGDPSLALTAPEKHELGQRIKRLQRENAKLRKESHGNSNR